MCVGHMINLSTFQTILEKTTLSLAGPLWYFFLIQWNLCPKLLEEVCTLFPFVLTVSDGAQQ